MVQCVLPLLALLLATASARVTEVPFNLKTFQVSEGPKMWVIDGLLSKELLNRVDEAFTIANATGNYTVPKFKRGPCAEDEEEESDQRGIQLTPEDSKELIATIKMLGHVRASYQDTVLILETPEGANHQDAHMDRFKFALHPENLAKTVNASLLHNMKEDGKGGVVPRVSFVINFSDVGGTMFPKATNTKFVPAKKGRLVMFENYVNGGANIDPRAVHYGVYDEKYGKRVVTGGILYNGEGPEFSSAKTSDGFVYFTKGRHHTGQWLHEQCS